MQLIVVVGALLVATLAKGELHYTLKIQEDLSSDGKIVEGQLAAKNQFPYVVYLKMLLKNNIERYCGGSLISSKHVLSAAHCYISASVISASFGSNDIKQPELLLTTSTYIIHPQFNPENLENDIGIAQLQISIPFSDSMKPIALPRRSQMSENFANKFATVAGWGYTANDGVLSQFMRYAQLSVITNYRCSFDYTPGIIVDSTVCAMGNTCPFQNTCNGDSGAPLVVFDQTENNYIQIGLASFVSGLGCGSGRASGYVRPHHYWSFISNYTGIPIKE